MLASKDPELFLSTPSARRATLLIQFPGAGLQFLSTPSARRATKDSPVLCCRGSISIHALREEGDPYPRYLSATNAGFLSTPSARRATQLSSVPVALLLFLSTPSARRATCEYC